VVFERFAAGKEKILEDPLLYIDISFFHKKGEDKALLCYFGDG